jgi:hypothetical protein
MKHKTNQALTDYWNEVRCGRVAPRRFEIEPARIAHILADTFILERSDADAYRYRLAGTRICELFGKEFRGRDFLADWSETDQITLARQLAVATQTGQILSFEFDACADDMPPLNLEGVLLPLLHNGSSISRFLGGLGIFGDRDWLHDATPTRRRLAASSLVATQASQMPDRPREPAPLTSLAGARLVKLDRRAFRVVDGGLAGKSPRR